ncbi:MAG: phage tail protein [Fimbriimonas sp.]
MKSRFLVPLAVASLAALAYCADTPQLYFSIDGVTSLMQGGSIWVETETEDYKDGDDPITHKRAGKAKYKNIVLKRGYVSDSSLDGLIKKVLAGTTDRKSGSVIYLDRTDSTEMRMEFEEDFLVRFPASGAFAQDDDGDGPTVKMKAKEKANRTKCANNLRLKQPTRPTSTSLTIDGTPLPGGGWTAIFVRSHCPDVDGDGFPDKLSIDSSNVRIMLSAADAAFIADWEKNTEAASGGKQMVKPVVFSWGVKGGLMEVSFNATLISVNPGLDGEIEIVCATENVVFRSGVAK